ncbi:MAG: FKBP-type peptidyl-prolyl cis-trans isomerase [Bacteroidetes bacterium]|nr:FKBP-type peptidyl-prolyl cis-trans isomerase [Bacteroidota bacterium]
MKKTLFTILFFSYVIANGQTQKPTAAAPVKKATPTTSKPVVVKPAVPVLKNEIDSVSYALGISLAYYYQSQGVSKVNGNLLGTAVNDLLNGGPTLLDNNSSNTLLNNYMTRLQNEKSKLNKEAGEKFLAENKKRAGVITTESGLQYEIITAGDGESPAATDTVTCHYKGTFIDGKGFDNSYDRDHPISFPLNGVIKGWTEGLQLMQLGAKYKFYIPYQLGYGEHDYMSIPGGSMLVFEVELIGIKRRI